MSAAAAMDYYRTLGVPKNATPADIKRQYHKLAMQWHPDRNPNNETESRKKFQMIGEAYEILSDHEKRAQYDRTLRPPPTHLRRDPPQDHSQRRERSTPSWRSSPDESSSSDDLDDPLYNFAEYEETRPGVGRSSGYSIVTNGLKIVVNGAPMNNVSVTVVQNGKLKVKIVNGVDQLLR